MPSPKRLTMYFFVICALLLQGCGFKLRGSQALPDNIKDVYLVADSPYAPLQRSLSKRLPVYQLKSIIIEKRDVSTIEEKNAVLIVLQPEALERRLLSVFSSGQVAEYELVYSVDYQVLFSGSEPIRASMTVSREYQDDPDQVLAKARELELVVEEMRLDSADRIIRLLSSQFTSAVPASAVKSN